MRRMRRGKSAIRKLKYLEKSGYLTSEIQGLAELHIKSISKIADDLDEEDRKKINSNESLVSRSKDEKSIQIDYFTRLILDVRNEGSFQEFFNNSFSV